MYGEVNLNLNESINSKYDVQLKSLLAATESCTQVGLTTGSPPLNDLYQIHKQKFVKVPKTSMHQFDIQRQGEPQILDFTVREITADYMCNTMP